MCNLGVVEKQALEIKKKRELNARIIIHTVHIASHGAFKKIKKSQIDKISFVVGQPKTLHCY